MRVRSSGFTLIEMMIVIAVIAILAAIALPAFNEQVRKSRRSEAMADVGALQLAMERWRADHPTYAGTGAGYPSVPVSSHYLITPTADATTYTFTASPQNAQTGDRCGNLVATANQKPIWSGDASCNQ